MAGQSNIYFFLYDEQECNTLNFASKINKIRQIIYQWRERDLTLIGLIQIIETFITSQFQHIISVIDFPEFYIKQIETIIYNFVWNGKRDKIKRSTLRKRKELGGLKAPDFRCIIQAAKLKWLFRLLNPDGKPWKSLCIHLFSKIKCPSCFTIIKNSKIPDFYKDALKTWDMLLETTPYTRNDFLWYNKLFPIDDNAVFFKQLSTSGINYVYDLVDSEGKIKPFEYWTERGLDHVHYLKWRGIVSCLQLPI